jgi:hypothetical protein
MMQAGGFEEERALAQLGEATEGDDVFGTLSLTLGDAAPKGDLEFSAVGPKALLKGLPGLLCRAWARQGHCKTAYVKGQCPKACASRQNRKKGSQWVGAFNLTAGRKVPLSDGKPMLQTSPTGKLTKTDTTRRRAHRRRACLTQVEVQNDGSGRRRRNMWKNKSVSSPVIFIPCHIACCHCTLPHCTLFRAQTCTSCRKDLAFVMYFHRAKAGKCRGFKVGAPVIQCTTLDKNDYRSAGSGQVKNLLCTKHTLARSMLRVSTMTPAVRRIFKQVEGKNGFAVPYWCPSHTHLTF